MVLNGFRIKGLSQGASLRRTPFQCLRQPGDTLAQGLAQCDFMLIQRALAVAAGMVTGAIRGAAALGLPVHLVDVVRHDRLVPVRVVQGVTRVGVGAAGLQRQAPVAG